MIDVTQTLLELDGTEIKQDARCPNCIRVYTGIRDNLPEDAHAEFDKAATKIFEVLSAESEPLTLRLVINRAIMTPLKKDELTPESGVKRTLLAMRIHESDEVELDSDEKTLVKDRVAKVYQHAPIIVGRVCLLVDPAMNKK